MKECCKTGTKSRSKLEIWGKIALWVIVALIVIGAALNQLFNT
jgi:hypothetical protein